jgi:Mg-chelatase subunit ChlD
MNPDQPSREQIETRITALLLGELPADEAALLRYTIAQDPALRKLHDQIQASLPLIREATKQPEEAPTEKPTTLKLSADRREKLLAHFKTRRPEVEQKPKEPLFWLKRINVRSLAKALAAVAIIALLAMMLLPTLSSSKHTRGEYGTSHDFGFWSGLRELSRSKKSDKEQQEALSAPPVAPPMVAMADFITNSTPPFSFVPESQLMPPPLAVSAQIVLPQPESAPAPAAQAGIQVATDNWRPLPSAAPTLFGSASSGGPAAQVAFSQAPNDISYGEQFRSLKQGLAENSSQTVTIAPEPKIAPPPTAVPGQIVLPQAEPAPTTLAGSVNIPKGGNTWALSARQTEAGQLTTTPSLRGYYPDTFGVTNNTAVALNENNSFNGLGGASGGGGGGGAGFGGGRFVSKPEVNGTETSIPATALPNNTLGDELNQPQAQTQTLGIPPSPGFALNDSSVSGSPAGHSISGASASASMPMGQFPTATPATEVASVTTKAESPERRFSSGLRDRGTGAVAANRFYRNQTSESENKRVPVAGDIPATGQLSQSSVGAVTAAPAEVPPPTPASPTIAGPLNYDAGSIVPGTDSLKLMDKSGGSTHALSEKNSTTAGTAFTFDTADAAHGTHGAGVTGITREDAEGLRYVITNGPPQPTTSPAPEDRSHFVGRYAYLPGQVQDTNFVAMNSVVNNTFSLGVSATQPVQPNTPAQAEEIIQPGLIDFEGVELSQVLDIYGKLANRTVLRSAIPQGQIVLHTQSPLTKTEAIQALQAALALNGVSLINVGDKFVKAVPIAQAGSTGQTSGLAGNGSPSAQTIEQSDLPLRKPAPNTPVPQSEILTSSNAFSTFAMNVSDVSFKFAEASLQNGKLPDTASIRSEEFINAFDYRDPEAAAGQPMAFTPERARYPFAHNRDLLRFSIKTAAAGRQEGRPLNLVILLDTSGSMERADRVAIIREALRVLSTQLHQNDIVSVVSFARTARLWADGVSGDKAGETLDKVGGITPEGGTNLEEAMRLAYETARRHYLANGINRVVLLTDGAANLGDVDPSALKQKVDAQRKQGIALDCFGIGWEDYNDDLLEQLSSNGDGRYAFLNSPEDASRDFAAKLAGALQVTAQDLKVQVEFNPLRVISYRQIGYATHQLTKQQFRDNTVAAGEIAAQEAGNALYTIETNPNGDGPIATVHVRYRIPGTQNYRELSWDVAYTGNAPALEQSSPAMRLAATASAFSEWLAASPYAQGVAPDALLNYLSGVPDIYGADDRPKQLETMIREAKSLEGK